MFGSVCDFAVCTHQVWHLIPCRSLRREILQLYLLCCFQNTIRQFHCVCNNAAPGIKLIFVLFPENAGAVDKAVANVGKRCRIHENSKNCQCDTVLVSCFPSSYVQLLLIPKIFFLCFTKISRCSKSVNVTIFYGTENTVWFWMAFFMFRQQLTIFWQ